MFGSYQLQNVYSIMALCAKYWILLVILIGYRFIGNTSGNLQLNASKLFVSLALTQFLNNIFFTFSIGKTSLIKLRLAIDRLNNFLNLSNKCNYLTSDDVIDNQYVISVENGSFTWDELKSNTNEIILNNINLNISDKQFVAIVGNVGAGKSSLLSALLGDMELLSGKVSINGKGIKIAYVSQQSWIQNATLRDNILFGKSFDTEFYEQVIHSCALRQDLKQLPAGDQTEIGEKGINLSGGQKQRISLARAVYSNADLYLLDDPLSAVDSHVSKHIMCEVFDSKTGLLKNKTRILATNQLFVLPNVDNIVVVNNGTITAIGSYDYLMNENKEFSDLLNKYIISDKESDKINDSNNNDITIRNDNQNITELIKIKNRRLIDDEYIESGNVTKTVY
ncbi:ATP-binding cassette sub-family C member 3-like [Oppia nitens]|uniref:ATP-binding cassette sub-family C member 3-like n=1 Tax=Oppia nitens TaxID=1686743 RepID=UPI0023DAEC12|nr:ATP-binding cassette sub-family C member 3-like [Oppia nitens]